MLLTTEILNQLTTSAIKAAQQAGDYIRGFDRDLLKVHFKDAGSSRSAQVVTEVDLTCQGIILNILQPCCDRYDLALLSEENADEQNAANHPRLSKDYFWCIDPLDGTLPFIEGSNGYAVSIALVSRCGKPLIAVVHQPTTNITYHTAINQFSQTICYKNKQPFTSPAKTNSNTFTFYCDRSFVSSKRFALLTKQLQNLAKQSGYDNFVINKDAGAVINALSVLENTPACYIKLPKKKPGGGCLWDFSASACLAQASNGWVSDIHGKPLDLNRLDSHYMNHRGILYASDQQLAQQLIEICALLRE